MHSVPARLQPLCYEAAGASVLALDLVLEAAD